jgi:F-type H+-transporting ATPase subunit b
MADIMESLGIDPMQVLVNFIGFAIFLWLMARYAWKPILGFMDERRADIAGNFRKIEQEKDDLEKLKRKYQDHLDRIEEEATRLIQEAIKEGQGSARRIEDDARSRAQTILQKARADTERILEEAKLELKDYVVDVGVEAGRKAAMGVLDESSHRRLVERFVEELTGVR